jgi:hypothetical protein
VLCSFAFAILGDRASGQSNTGEVEVVGTVEAVEDAPTGEVEVVGTVEAVEDVPTGEVEVVGTIALPQTLARVSSWAQIKLLRASGFLSESPFGRAEGD